MFLPFESEGDLRSCYCAVAISLMCKIALKNEKGIIAEWGFDTQKLIEFILKCRTVQGGFGFENNPEAHSGLTYCAVASLNILGYKFEK